MHESPSTVPVWIELLPEVRATLQHGEPLVALESSLITHGLPRPVNLEVALELEGVIRSAGARPATVGILNGQVHVGLSVEALTELANAAHPVKVSLRDIGPARARRRHGGTTVAATIHLARAASLDVFATGGIGGVHSGGGSDISADLPVLERTPMVVVCAGPKSLLDQPRTLEWLETHSVPTIGWQTDELPAFFSRESGLRLHERVETAAELAEIARSHWSSGSVSAVLLCAACPTGAALPFARVDAWRQQAEQEAEQAGVRGAALTPFLLARMAEHSQGATLRANRALLRHNAEVAAAIAVALHAR
jgi:pseudouridine-5'-phosphate glycosidase